MFLHKKNNITSEEYLNAERISEFKNEYFNGEIFAMAGASREHNQISSNIIRVLGNQLLESPCTIFASDMKIKIEAIEKYTYPDIVVICGNEEFEYDNNDHQDGSQDQQENKQHGQDKYKEHKQEDENGDILINPLVIMEILSTSTEAYDRGDKFSHYQFIESFVEYILISQYFYRVEKFMRHKDGTWIYSTYNNPEDIVKIASVNCELPVAEIYRKVDIRKLYEL